MRKKLKKHPMQMTDEEALQHLFHPKIVKKVKEHLETQKKPKPKNEQETPSQNK